jgi:hypothetical protein
MKHCHKCKQNYLDYSSHICNLYSGSKSFKNPSQFYANTKPKPSLYISQPRQDYPSDLHKPFDMYGSVKIVRNLDQYNTIDERKSESLSSQNPGYGLYSTVPKFTTETFSQYPGATNNGTRTQNPSTNLQNPRNLLSQANSKHLRSAILFLNSINDYKIEINEHKCYRKCLICKLLSLLRTCEEKELLELNESVQKSLEVPLEILTAIDGLEIILKSIHEDYIKYKNSKNCYFYCISHKLFALNIVEEIKCLCGKKEDFAWNESNFVFPVYYEDAVVSFENALLHSNRRTYNFCVSGDCKVKRSSKSHTLTADRSNIIISLLYEEFPETIAIEKFSVIRIPEDAKTFKLCSVLIESETVCCTAEIAGQGWVLNGLGTRVNSIRELSQLINSQKLRPVLLGFSLQRNF